MKPPRFDSQSGSKTLRAPTALPSALTLLRRWDGAKSLEQLPKTSGTAKLKGAQHLLAEGVQSSHNLPVVPTD